MRKVTEQIGNALANSQEKRVGNTVTDGNTVWLHGNEIVRRNSSGKFSVTMAGWPTPTTRERINGIMQVLGIDFHIFQHNYEQYAVYNGSKHLLDSSDTFHLGY